MQIFPLKKDKSPACKSWKTYTGDVKTSMYGISPPKGIFIIDTDDYKTGDIQTEIEKALGCKLDWTGAHIQKTLNGGNHYAFCVPDSVEMVNGANLLGVDGFDTRAAERGYIATGDGYTVTGADGELVENLLNDLFLPDLPQIAVDKLSNNREEKENDDLLDLVTKDQIEIRNNDGTQITIEQIQHVMDNLPAEIGTDNDSWVKVCAGLKRQCLSQEMADVNDIDGWGYETLDAWSQTRDGYTSNDKYTNFTRWLSFGLDDSSDPITFSSLIAMAGGMPQFDEKGEIIHDAAPFVKNYVQDGKSGRYLCIDTKAEYCKAAFDSLLLNETPLNKKGVPIRPSKHADGKLEVVSGSVYRPDEKEVFTSPIDNKKYLNLYRAATHLPRTNSGIGIDLVKNHLAHLVENEREREIILYYLAYNLQHSGKKIPWAIILQGSQGDGKSFLSEMMIHLLGLNNVRIMNAQTLESNFTGWATGQTMVFIEELKLDNFKKYEIVNKIKPYISNPTVEMVRKGLDPIVVPNTSNYMAFTNHKDAIPLTMDDRRYAIIFSRWQGDKVEQFVAENQRYYPDLYDNMRANISNIYHDFMDIDIPDWFLSLNRAPKTAARSEMIMQTKPLALQDLESAVEDFKSQVIIDSRLNITLLNKLVTDLRFTEEDDSLYANFPDPVRDTKKLITNLGEMGWRRSAKRRRINKVLSTVYVRK